MRGIRWLVLSVVSIVAAIGCGFSLNLAGSSTGVEMDAELQVGPAPGGTEEFIRGKNDTGKDPQTESGPATAEGLEGAIDAPEESAGTGVAEVKILEAEMGTDLPPESIYIQDPKQVFEPDEEVYISLWTLLEGSAEVPYRAVVTGPDGRLWYEEESTVWTGETGWYLLGYLPPGGWRPGAYTVELFFDDQLAETWNFTVVTSADTPTQLE